MEEMQENRQPKERQKAQEGVGLAVTNAGNRTTRTDFERELWGARDANTEPLGQLIVACSVPITTNKLDKILIYLREIVLPAWPGGQRRIA